MLYLGWMLLNIAFLILFIYLLVKATKLIAREKGVGWGVLFVIVILSVSASSPDEEKTKIWEWKNPERGKTKHSPGLHRHSILNNIMFGIKINIHTYKDSANHIYIDQISVSKTGNFMGYNWKTLNISHTLNENQFHYSLNGEIRFDIANFPLFYTSRLYEGMLILE